MNGADSSSLRAQQQRDNFPGSDDVTSPVNGTVGVSTAGGSSNGNANNQNVNANHMSSMYGAGNDVHMPPGSANSLVRSQSSASSGSSSMTGGNGNGNGMGGLGGSSSDRITPPALQLPLAALAAGAAAQSASMFNTAGMAFSHYGPASLGAVAATLNSAAAAASGFRSPSVTGNGTSLRRYTCKLCNEMFESKAELQLHAQVHMREAKPYKCSHCPKNFANSSYLSQHMRIHLGIKPFGPCQYCQRKFTQLSHLQQHLRTHTGDKPYKCRYPNCEKAFSQLSNLQSHSRCHQSDKPFKCNSCYKCFSDEQSLLEHIPKHKESKHLKVHICSFCGKSYTQATYLAKHMTKHSDRKPGKGGARSDGGGGHASSASLCHAIGSNNGATAGASGVGASNDDPHGGSGANNASMWSPRDSTGGTGQGGASGSLCSIHGVVDTCNEVASPNAFPFNSFHQQLANPMMQSQTCAYTSGIASTMAAAGMGAPDPSAFTRLAGLTPAALTGRFSAAAAASSRNPYSFAYENFKSSPHTSGLGHHSAPYNQLIRLDDIRNYAGHQAQAAAAAASAEHFGMLMKQQQQQQQQQRDPRESAY